MGMVGQLVVHAAELLEAEGRLARRGLFRLVQASAMVLVAALMLVLAMGAMAAAVLLALLAAGLDPAIACLLVGLVLLVVGLLMLAIARVMAGSHR
jgi:hypothetical protein